MMKITEEMVRLALSAEIKAMDKEWDMPPCSASIRAALEAVAPLIVEECARVIDDAAREAQTLLLSSTHSAPMFGAIMHAHVRTAAAIRGLAKELAQAKEEE